MRALRFPQSLPLIYRLAGEPGWQEGLTENISSSGILFSATRDLPVDANLEMRIPLSPALPSGYAPTVVCHVRVVRTESRQSGTQLFGAALCDCEVIPPEDDQPFKRKQ